jgi:ectoine hydroxylase
MDYVPRKHRKATAMDFETLATQFWQDGFLVLHDFFDSATMDNLNQVILNHFGEDPQFLHNEEFLRKSKADVIPWFPQREGVRDFDPVGNTPQFQRLTAAILGEQWQEQYTMVMFSAGNSHGQSWHQDCPPEDPRKFNLNRLVYTHDINESTGGRTVVIPGTHKKGLLPAGQPDEDLEGQVVLSLKRGTLLMLHGHCWHRVLPIHECKRVSTNFRSAPQGTPEGITDICVYRNMRYQFSTSQVIEERGA